MEPIPAEILLKLTAYDPTPWTCLPEQAEVKTSYGPITLVPNLLMPANSAHFVTWQSKRADTPSQPS